MQYHTTFCRKTSMDETTQESRWEDNIKTDGEKIL
jgi:hypothetical protein